MKTINYLLLFTLLFSSFSCEDREGEMKYNVTQVVMDSAWDGAADPAVSAIVNYYQPKLKEIMDQVIAISEVEMASRRPESLLSNFTTDLMLEYANLHFEKGADLALTNFGGLRATLPKGEVRRYDLYSIFPFENSFVVAQLYGSSLIKMFESFARNRVEALSGNVQLEIKGGKLKSAKIDGADIDKKRLYRVITIDFLLDGGDKVVGLNEAREVEKSDILMRDAMIDMLLMKSEKGERLNAKLTKRVIME